MNVGMDQIIKEYAKKSGLPEEKISDITSSMVEYLNTGAKYGESPKGFFTWYMKDKGKKLFE